MTLAWELWEQGVIGEGKWWGRICEGKEIWRLASLWLTGCLVVLACCSCSAVQVVTEPPDGLKLNMRSTYSKIDQAMLDEIPHRVGRPVSTTRNEEAHDAMLLLCIYKHRYRYRYYIYTDIWLLYKRPRRPRVE